MSDDVVIQHLREQLKAMTERAEQAEKACFVASEMRIDDAGTSWQERAEKAEARVKVFCDLLGRDTVTDRAEDDLEIAVRALRLHDVVGSIDEVVHQILQQKEEAEETVLQLAKEKDELRARAVKLRKIANGVFVAGTVKKDAPTHLPMQQDHFEKWRCMDCYGISTTSPDDVVHGLHKSGNRNCALAEFEDLR